MSTPFFSIVIPSYNRAKTIGRAVQSCLKQTYTDFEIIIVDDQRSTDNMHEALEPYQSQCQISLVTDHSGSAAAARNTGVNHALGKYIAFLDADDVYLPSKLATMAEHLKNEPDTLFFSQNYVDRGVGNLWVKPARGLQENENIFDYLFVVKGWVHPSSLVVPTQLAKDNQFNESLSFGDDTQFVASLWLKGIKITMIELPLTLYDDPYKSDRLSQSPVFESGKSQPHQSFMTWVESQKNEMPEKAYRAYRAYFRSRFFARHAPLEALGDILQAWQHDVFSVKQCLQQILQTFAPGIYRHVADTTVRYRGINPQGIITEYSDAKDEVKGQVV